MSFDVFYSAWNTSANGPETGDEANHTVDVEVNGTPVTGLTEAEVGNGRYKVTLSDAQCPAGARFAAYGSSSTADVEIFGESGVRPEAMRGTDGANTQTPLNAAGVRTAVGLAAADLDTQLATIADDASLASTHDEIDVANAVRTELATELGRIDATIASRSTLTAAQVWQRSTALDTGDGTYGRAFYAETAGGGAGDVFIWADARRWLGSGIATSHSVGGSAVIPVVAVETINGSTAKSDIRDALGMSAANLDTQLAAIPDAAADSIVLTAQWTDLVDDAEAARLAAESAEQVTDQLATMLEADGSGGWQFTTLAVENAPSGGGGGGDATAANQTTIIATLGSMAGAGFETANDSLEAIRNRGDAAWSGGGGGGVTFDHAVTVTIDDTGGQLVRGALVVITDTDGVPTGAQRHTDTLGVAPLTADDGDYLVRVTPPTGYETPDPVALNVNGAAVPVDITLVPVAITPAAAPEFCTVRVRVRSQYGTPLEDADVVASLGETHVAADSVLLNVTTAQQTDADGIADLTLIRNTEFKVRGTGYKITATYGGRSVSIDFVVPNAPTATATLTV